MSRPKKIFGFDDYYINDSSKVWSVKTKLTEQDVLEIRKLWWDVLYPQQKIANLYGVSQNMVSKIIRRENWKHI